MNKTDATRFVEALRASSETNVEGYEIFQYTRRYLRDTSAAFDSRQATRELGEALGYNTSKGNFFDKFRRHVDEWNALRREVPFRYLDAIGADRDVLALCLEADHEHYERQRHTPRYPTSAAIRYVASFYGRIPFPPGTTEEEAIDRLMDNEYIAFRRIILYSGLLMIRIEPGADTTPEYIWFPPTWTWRRSTLLARRVPEEFGRMRFRR